jgi:hypothetical protein
MPPEAGKAYVKEFVRVLGPGGLLVFQAAGEPIEPPSGLGLRGAVRRLVPGWALRAYHRLKRGHHIDMYGIPREEVMKLLSENGASVLETLEDTSAGGEWTSFHYFAQKQ